MRQRDVKWLILSLPDQNFLFPRANLSNLINH
ncbi:hypothetical protein MTR67_030523 [Solanum verrucosum]|uniref:Uncharacterized protein n=1 Tax=Solanum verrucosum TaxID=315347 RepID=A0AAF0R9G8_SOLVR|nr:hypothetical protein MTR67_030523 [Solanum verrucosum]